MSRLCAILGFAAAAAVALAQPTGHDIHFYFSLQPPPALGGPNQVPPEYVSGTNPVMMPGQTAYLWAFIIDPDPASGMWDVWNGMNLMLSRPAVGAAYNPSMGGALTRWESGCDFTWEDDPQNDILLAAVHTWGLGNEYEFTMFQNAPGLGKYFAGGPTQPTLHWAVAPVIIDEYSPVYLGIGPGGIARRGGVEYGDRVAVGFTPEGQPDYVPYGEPWSVYPDLYVIPEPATLLLLALSILPLRRR